MRTIKDYVTKTFKGLNYVNVNNKQYQKPVQCPECGLGIDARQLNLIPIDITKGTYLVVQYQCTCCDYVYAVTYLMEKGSDTYNFISIYPKLKDIQFGDWIKNTSPRFIELYNQAYSAEKDNHLELAGCGYRNAMEILLKDYLIKEVGIEKTKIAKKDLFKVIEEYLPDYGENNVANVIRILGNDNTHYERYYEDMDFSILKDYIGIFITLIEAKLKVLNPPVKKAER